MKILQRLLTGSALAVALTSVASASSIIGYTASFGPTTGSTYTMNLQQFNASFGTLTAVTLYFKATENVTAFSIQNTSAASQDWDLSVTNNLVATFSNTATAADKFTAENLEVFDTGIGGAKGNCNDTPTTTVKPNTGSGCVGTQTLGAGGTDNVGPFSLSNTDTNYGLTTGTGNLGTFGAVKNGTVISNYIGGSTFTLSGTTAGGTSFQTAGTNNEVLTTNGTTSYTVEVDYTYTAASGTPEPTTMILLGSSLLGLGLIRRKSVKQ